MTTTDSRYQVLFTRRPPMGAPMTRRTYASRVTALAMLARAFPSYLPVEVPAAGKRDGMVDVTINGVRVAVMVPVR